MRNFICLLLLSLSIPSFGQIKFVNEFLNIGVGARGQAMAGSVSSTVGDNAATYWNPAALTNLDAPFAVMGMHSNWFGGLSNYDYFSIAKQLNNGNAYGGISLIRMGIDNIPNTFNLIGADGSINYENVVSFSAVDYAVLLSYGQKLKVGENSNKKISVGGNVKIIRRSIGSFGGAWGFGADFGFLYRANRYSFSLVGKDITTTFNTWSFSFTDEEKNILVNTGNDVPISSTEVTLPRLIIGNAYKFGGDKFSVLAELDLNISTNGTKAGLIAANHFSLDPSIGLEFGFFQKVYVRGGMGNVQRTLNDVYANTTKLDFLPTVGLGLQLGRLSLDYALSNIGSQSDGLSSHIFSLGLKFAPKK